MIWLRRTLLIAVAAGLLGGLALWKGASDETLRSSAEIKDALAHSVVRYATDEMIAACFVRPKGLIEHGYFGTLPIDSFLPAPVSLGRLDDLEVEELVVFYGPAGGLESDGEAAAQLEWGAVARTAQSIDLESFIKGWRRSLAPQAELHDEEPIAMQIGNYACFQVPAGTFIARPRRYCELRFTDKNGQAAQRGINVGNIFEFREYLEGNTEASAIFTLEQIGEGDLVDGILPLELRLDVFRTYFPDEEFTTAMIQLRNPDNSLISEPISFQANSHVNQLLSVPRQLTAEDGDAKRQVDLLDDLIAKNKLEVILKGTDSRVYLGVGEYDLNVKPATFEYVFVDDREIAVATSFRILEQMLNAAVEPGSQAERLAQSNGDIVMIANARNESERAALQHLTRTISDAPISQLLGESLIDLTATLSVNGPAKVRVTAEFRDRTSAGRAKAQLDEQIRAAKNKAHAEIGNALNRIYAIGSLISLMFDGMLPSLPGDVTSTSAERESALLSMIDDSLDAIQTRSIGTELTVRFTQPESLSDLSAEAQIALSDIEAVLGRDLFQREKFDLGVEMYRRATSRVPHEARVWFWRAHQLSYNVPAEVDGYKKRYAWVHRGIDVLLDGAEQNTETTDLTWLVASFIGRKIGEADERDTYRRLFSQDDSLHQRLANLIDIEQARSPDQNVDNWLVAKLLFEYCIDRHETSATSSSVPPLLMFSRPASTQARYAHALSEVGHWEESQAAWQEAERLLQELGERTIVLKTSERIRLNELESRSARLGLDDPSVKQLQAARSGIRYDEWLTLCKFERIPDVWMARQLSHKAAERAGLSDHESARDVYRESLLTLSAMSEMRPSEMALLAGEFKQVAEGYQNSVEELGETPEPDLSQILALIDQTESVATGYGYLLKVYEEQSEPSE